VQAIRTEQSNFTFLGPRPEVADLPGRLEKDQGRFFAVFALTDEERAMIANGAQVRIGIWSIPIPPISMSIVNEREAPGEEQEGVPLEPDYRCERCSNLYVSARAIELELVCGWCGGALRLPGATV
jgi:hypothetical protein